MANVSIIPQLRYAYGRSFLSTARQYRLRCGIPEPVAANEELTDIPVAAKTAPTKKK